MAELTPFKSGYRTAFCGDLRMRLARVRWPDRRRKAAVAKVRICISSRRSAGESQPCWRDRAQHRSANSSSQPAEPSQSSPSREGTFIWKNGFPSERRLTGFARPCNLQEGPT